jgi:hypothetical protein
MMCGWVDGLGKMDACVRITQYYSTTTHNPQASRHIFASTTTGLAPCLGKGWIAAAYARRALSQVMIVRPRCAWCMEACCLFHAWYLAVSSLQSGIPCPTHTLTCLALPCLLRLMLLAVSRRRPVKKNVLTHQTHGVLRLNRSSSGCHDVRSGCPGQARPDQR